MCGRFSFTQTEESVKKNYHAEIDIAPGEKWPAGKNKSPFSRAVIIQDEEGNRLARIMEWGLMPPNIHAHKDLKFSTFNAKSETLLERRTFSEPFLTGKRCLVLVDGYYEWRDEGAKKKQPYYFRPKRRDTMAFAGLWEKTTLNEGGVVKDHYSCTIITCQPNDVTGEYHDRMPVILDPSVQDKWLSHDTPVNELQALLVPPSDDYLKIDKRDPREEEEKRRAENPELF
jgi:putative SOS response-associated peptidase YedK